MTEQKHHLYSIGKTYYRHTTKYLTAEQVESLFAGCEKAYNEGMELNRFFTIHYDDYAAPKRPQEFVTDILERTRKWLQYRGLPVAYLYVIENGKTKGIHTHILIHIPKGHQIPYKKALKKWVPFEWTKTRVDVRPVKYPDFGKLTTLSSAYGTMQYMCKGIDPETPIRDITPRNQGEVMGRRWGMSASLKAD